jgi:D-xylose transport system substrate-binding protein
MFALVLSGQLARAGDGNQLKIGFSIEDTKGERWQTDLNSFEVQAKQLGAEVISSDAGGDDDRQFQQVKDMIKAGIRVLVLLPRDTSKASRMVDAAKAANVKIISYDRLVLNSNVDLYVSFDREEIGRLQAESLIKHSPKGNYVLIAGSPNDGGAKILHDVQLKVLQPQIDRGDIKVIADGYTKDWLPSEAYLFMLKVIDSSQGNIAAVLASNDGLAGGAIQALREHNLHRRGHADHDRLQAGRQGSIKSCRGSRSPGKGRNSTRGWDNRQWQDESAYHHAETSSGDKRQYQDNRGCGRISDVEEHQPGVV